MPHNSSRQFVNFSLPNTSDVSIPCTQEIYLREPILKKQDDYEVSITKLRIPSTNLELLREDDMSAWRVSFTEPLSSYSMPNFRRSDHSLYGHDEYPIKSMHDFKENVNLTMLRAYRDFMQVVDPGSTVNTIFPELTCGTGSTTHNLIMDAAVYTKICHVRLEILSATTLAGVHSNHGPVTIKLRSPLGTEVIVSAGSLWPLPHISGTEYLNVVFEDHSPNENPTITVEGNKSYRSLAGFSTLHNDSPDGTWVLEVIGDSSLDVDLDVQLTITCVAGERSNFAPTISFSDGTGYLSINYPEKFQANNTLLGFSPRLHTVLGFDSTFSPTNNEYHLRFDHSVLSPPLDGLITRVMERASIETMSNITSINITSQSLLTLGELNSDKTISSTIASFNPDWSREPGEMQFDSTSLLRRYPMLSNSELVKLDVGVEVMYTTGKSVLHTLAPGENFYASIVFVRNAE